MIEMTDKKYVYSFEEGKGLGKEILGGKGANLADMVGFGLPVPPGFIITTETCRMYYESGRKMPADAVRQIEEHLQALEKKMGRKLGAKDDPLLVSVRSGAAASMPGMMDTILNLGLNDESVVGLAKKTGNERFAWDSYRRFIQMFGDVVMGVDHDKFEHALEEIKKAKGAKFDTDLNAEDMIRLVEKYKKAVKESTGRLFPSDPREQLRMSIDAVFGSWNNDRAVTYRRLNDIKGLLGTAVSVQSMVFGNMGETSGTGVCFTRNPSTGENKFYGEFLMNAQGEDVVAGIRTPRDISELGRIMHDCYGQLVEIYKSLEKSYRDMQDMEFTIQEGRLYILQTRNGKRTAAAAVKIAVDMVREKLIDEKTAVMRVQPSQLDQLLHKMIDPIAKKEAELLTRGLPASPGAAVGEAVFTAEAAKAWAEEGKKVILVRTETSPEDIEGMHAAQGILTARGGMTSHAAVVARGMGKCCVAGAGEIHVSEKEKFFEVGGVKVMEGDMITLDGSMGEVFKGSLRVVDPEMSGDFATLMKWADGFRKIGVRTNADTPHDAEVAKKFGAEGIGLCRTEHMFFEGDRIKAMREMILADDTEGRKKALAKLLPFQKNDFKGLFKVMSGMPIIIRFLDPPLHEFLPKEDREINELAKELCIPASTIKAKIESLHEFNPMLGFRGCRLGVVYPEISEMQARAIFEAAIEAKKEGANPVPEIEVPNVITVNEFRLIKNIVDKVAKELDMHGKGIRYKVGTMIEFPRAVVIADELAKEADFFSFGTNDLTQTILGFSRDDAGRFIPIYVEKGALEYDPFQRIDEEGVGALMKMAVQKGRSVKPNLDIGICGEHGGEPASVEFCHRIGLSNVSCSPYRVPIARLAAAQAAIKDTMK